MLCSLALLSLSIAGAVDLPRHVDPSLLGLEYPFVSQLFGLYRSAFSSIIAGEFVDARSLIDTALEVYVPPDSRELFDGYNGLVSEVIGEFESTESSLDSALGHLRWMRENLAEDSLDEAVGFLLETNVTIGLIEVASMSIASDFRGAPDQLLQGVGELGLHLEDLRFEIGRALDEVESIRVAGLHETEVLVEALEDEVLVGDSAYIAGYLSDKNGTVLPL